MPEFCWKNLNQKGKPSFQQKKSCFYETELDARNEIDAWNIYSPAFSSEAQMYIASANQANLIAVKMNKYQSSADATEFKI